MKSFISSVDPSVWVLLAIVTFMAVMAFLISNGFSKFHTKAINTKEVCVKCGSYNTTSLFEGCSKCFQCDCVFESR